MKKVNLVLLCAILLVSGLIIGSPIKYNAVWLNSIIMIIGIVYIIVQKWKDKEYKIIQNGLDIGVFTLCMILPVLPIIFHTFASLNDSVIYVYKYANAFVIYLMARDICRDNKEKENCLIHTILLVGIFLCLLGIDNMTTNWMNKLLTPLNLVNVTNIEGRMFSTFGYANSFAIYIAVCTILTIGQYKKAKNLRIKAIYGALLFLFFSCVILSYSKASILFLAIAILVIFFMTKDRNQKLESIFLCITEGILSLFYSMLWTKFIHAEAFIALWIITGMVVILAYGICFVVNKLQNRLQKVNTKTYYFIAIGVVTLLVIFVVVGLQFTKPLVLFNTKNSVQEVKYKVTKVEPNKEYRFVFDIDAISKLENKQEYAIEIVEENKYYDEIQSTQIEFNTFKGEKEIVIHTLPETVEIAIYIKCNYEIAKEKLVIQSLYINNQEYVLQYAYLPVSLVNKIKDINPNTKSAWERMTFYQDAVKLMKKHPLIGMGGNAWLHTYRQVQQYSYQAKEVHSYIVQVIVEYGMLGFIALVGIVGCIVRIAYLLKKKEKWTTSFSILLIATFLLLIHSAMDFDLSFLCNMFLLFCLLGMISANAGKKIQGKIADNIIGIVIIIVFGIYTWFSIQEVTIQIMQEKAETIEEIEQRIARVPYKKEYKEEKIKFYQEEKKEELLLQAIESLIATEPNTEKINYWAKIEYTSLSKQQQEEIVNKVIQEGLRIDPVYNKARSELLLQIATQSGDTQIIQTVVEIVTKENELIIDRIKDQEVNRLTKQQIEILLQDQNSKIEQINQMQRGKNEGRLYQYHNTGI